MNKNPIEPKKNYLWVYLLIIVVAAIVFWTVFVEEVEVYHHGQLQPQSHSNVSISSGGTSIGYSTFTISYETTIRAKFFQVSPAPDPSDIVTFGISTSLRKNQSIIKNFGVRALIINNAENNTTIDSVKKLVQLVKADTPDANYMEIIRVEYQTKTKGFGIGLSAGMPMPFDKLKEVSKE
jgi:hypothetical protein